MNLSLAATVRTCALLACACVFGMIGIFFATGIGQDPLQFVHSSAEYAAILLKNPPVLRAALMFDNFFVVFYATLFLALGGLLVERGGAKVMVFAATGLLLGVAFLDMLENFHFLVMLAGVEHGVVPSTAEIGAQVLESLFKFHVSYLGLLLLGFALPRTTRAERLFSNLAWFVQLPVGILIYVVPHGVALPLVFVRFTCFVVGLLALAAAFGPRRGAADSSAPALLRDRMRDAVG
jgi:hypothetical protein